MWAVYGCLTEVVQALTAGASSHPFNIETKGVKCEVADSLNKALGSPDVENSSLARIANPLIPRDYVNAWTIWGLHLAVELQDVA